VIVNHSFDIMAHSIDYTAQQQSRSSLLHLARAVGALSMQRPGLNVQVYDPMVHYQQVREAWVGLRNPDGR
jgi:outer membrane protein